MLCDKLKHHVFALRTSFSVDTSVTKYSAKTLRFSFVRIYYSVLLCDKVLIYFWVNLRLFKTQRSRISVKVRRKIKRILFKMQTPPTPPDSLSSQYHMRINSASSEYFLCFFYRCRKKKRFWMGESSIMLYSGINARMPNVVKSSHLHLIAQIQFVESTLRLLFREFLQLKKIILIPWICRVVSSDQYSLLKFSMFFFQPLLLF